MLNTLVFVGFNSRIAALNRDNGELVWDWKSPHGSGYVTVLLDGDRLIVSVVGYTYCLDPATGNEIWHNDLPGFGTGVASLASIRGCIQPYLAAAEADAQAQAAAAHPSASS